MGIVMDTKVIILVVTLLATAMWHIGEVDSAIVRSQQEFSKEMQETMLQEFISKVRDLRSADFQERNKTRHTCQGNPCGWATYTKFTRNFESFYKNTCDCPDHTYKCVKVDEALSVSAYIYRCRQNTTANDTEAPPDDSDTVMNIPP